MEKNTATAATAARSASSLIILSVLSRLLTFLLNQLLLRLYLSPSLLGASAQLELYSITVLTFSRETIRITLQRATHNVQAVVNFAYLSLILGLFFSIGLAQVYERSGYLPSVPHARSSLYLYAVASVIELLAEPAFAFAQLFFLYGVRASAESLATLTRCLTTFVTAAYLARRQSEIGVAPFTAGQLAYALTLLTVYLVKVAPAAKRKSSSLLPSRKGGLKPEMFTLAANLYLQESVKYLLTQGDSLVVSVMATLQEQGAYALAANYGGLVARMVFQPVEESSRNLFAKLCSAPASGTEADGDAAGRSAKKASPSSSSSPSLPSPSSIAQARTALTTILHLYALLTLFAWGIGPHAAPLALQLLLGSRFAAASPNNEAAAVLAAYTYLIPLLAFNGLLEAFVASVATPAQLRRQSVLMGIWSAAFAGAAVFFLCPPAWSLSMLSIFSHSSLSSSASSRAGANHGHFPVKEQEQQQSGLGGRGIVHANMVHYILRLAYNAYFVGTWFENCADDYKVGGTTTTTTAAAATTLRLRVRGIMPSGTAIAAAVLARAILDAPSFFVFGDGGSSRANSGIGGSAGPSVAGGGGAARGAGGAVGAQSLLLTQIAKLAAVVAGLVVVVAFTERRALQGLLLRMRKNK